ncbi:M23 family metallopeptidase [Streptomyces broussonetiae]|uniref:Peptidoglycan DD-metalloendopeptidase family protein n=1 Tax=Streptomyces broussonetiae TaxID=2686304 RepID=A0A6I6N617_9ACTN|nr:M23 family metallopeptidase [Streptomyces broussonetiae]QHA06089.1 peptidoglycan DD-metalloendopeptidase family protein [Streptomyces broussonetiae]
MFQRATSRSSRTPSLRTRVTVLAAGIGAAAVVGTGVASAAAPSAASWVDPVRKYTLSARFMQSGAMWQARHSGQDFAVPTGTEVVATRGGAVVKAGPNGAGEGPAYGNAIVVKHADGAYSQYAHLSRIDVKVGQGVATGQRIALSGSTGNSTGPHLHFEIRTTPHHGSAVDPAAFLRGKGVTL